MAVWVGEHQRGVRPGGKVWRQVDVWPGDGLAGSQDVACVHLSSTLSVHHTQEPPRLEGGGVEVGKQVVVVTNPLQVLFPAMFPPLCLHFIQRHYHCRSE